jgi:hypothetical protein
MSADLGPAVIVFIDPDAFAPGDARENPSCENFGRWIFKTWNVVEQVVVQLPNDRTDLVLDFREVSHETSLIQIACDDDLNAIRMAVQATTSMVLRNTGQKVRGLEAEAA